MDVLVLVTVGLVPFASGAVRTFRSAPRALSGTRVLGRVGAAALREGARVIENLPSVPADRALMEIADSGSDAAKRALGTLFGACVVASMAAPICLQGIDPSYWPRLGAVQNATGGHALILKLADGLASGRFLAQDVERTIALLEDLNVTKNLVSGVGAMPRGLSANAVEGLLVFVSKGMKKSPNRLKFAWEEIVLELGGNTAIAMDKMEQMLGLMNKADNVTPSIPGLGDFFALGPGTCRPCRSTAGFFHHLEYADSLGFSKIHSIDRALPPNYPGRPDLIIRVLDPNNPTKSLLKQVELKSIRATNRLGGKALAQLTKNLEKAAERATATAAVAGKPSAAELLGEMPIYVFREADSPAIRAQLLAKLTGNPDYSALAPQIVAPNSPYLKFLGLPPF